MSFNRQRLKAVLLKWPITFPKKEYDYGYRLRDLIKNKPESEEVFQGTPADNNRKIDALMRLANNVAKNEFPCYAKIGACGHELKEIEQSVQKNLRQTDKA